MLAKCSDQLREIKYTVRNGPHLGKIIMETSEGAWLNVDRFTQKDVNNSKVFYEHTKQFMDLSANDSFTFDVEAHFTESLTNQASFSANIYFRNINIFEINKRNTSINL